MSSKERDRRIPCTSNNKSWVVYIPGMTQARRYWREWLAIAGLVVAAVTAVIAFALRG